MIKKLSKWVVKHPSLILIIAAALVIPSAVGYFCTGVNYDILSLLPEQKEASADINETNAIFGLNEVIDNVFDASSTSFVVIEDLSPKQINRLRDKILDVEGVEQCIWAGSVADISIPQSMYPDAVKEMLYSADEKATLMLIQYDHDDGGTYDSIAKVNAVKEVLDKEHCFVFGLSAVMSDTKALINQEMYIYIAVAIGLAYLVLTLATKQWLIPGVVLLTLGCAVIYNMGTNFFFGDISYLTQSIAAILQLAVTIDYSIILLDRFEEECTKTSNVRKAMAKSIAYSFNSLIGGASTTFFGFISLCFMSLTLGLEMGLIMAKGIIFGLASVLIIMPAFLLKFYKVIFAHEHKRFVPKFDKLVDFVIKHKKVMTAIFFLLFIPMYILQANVSTYTDLNGKMPDDCDSRIATVKMQEKFNMASIHFVIVSDSIPSGEVSSMIGEFENVGGVTNVIALNKFVGAGISENILPDSIKSICEKGGYRLMALMSEYDLGSRNSEGENLLTKQKTELNTIIKSYDPKGCISGENILYDELVDIANADFQRTSIVSISAIFILIAFVLQSGFLPLLLVASIELAIFINISLSTIMGTEICFISPIVISCVQLGATVDYAILLSCRFKEELQRGHEKHEAMSIAAKAASKSIFQSALIFCLSTLGVIFVCSLELVKGMCVLLARGAIISAVVIICFLTPVLLCFEGVINKTSIGWRKPSDKKRGDKKMKASKIAKSAVSLCLCLSLAAGFAGCAQKETEEPVKDNGQTVLYDKTAENVTKTETVYVNLNSKGQVTQETVTDWLHTDVPNVRVYDRTDLELDKIQNVKGDSMPISNQNDNKEILWNLDSTDLYYTAPTNKKLPVEIGIRYFLNGAEMSAEDIAGQAGEVRIEFTFKNNYSKAVKVSGQTKKMYLPVLMLGGLVLPEKTFSAVKVKNGRAIGDGTNELVMIHSLPGVSESLNISSNDLKGFGNIELTNTASVTTKTSSFEMENIYFAAIPIASLDFDFDASGQVDSLQSALKVLKSLMNTLNSIDINQMMNTLTSNSANINELSGVINNAVKVYDSNQKLLNALTTTLTTENINTLKKLLDDLNDDRLKNSIATVTNSEFLKSLMNIGEIADDLQKAQPVINQLSALMNDPEIQRSLDNLDETVKTINELQSEIEKNRGLINSLGSMMSDKNVDAITNISRILANSDLNLADYGIVVDDTDEFVALSEAWLEVGKGYKIFTDASSSASTNVAFIYMTPSISKGFEDTVPESEIVEEEKVPWYKKIFG